MFNQKYKPKNINELSFNKNLSKKLQNIPLHNIIIYGAKGSGKLVRAYCYLSNIFGESVNNTKLEMFNLSKDLSVSYNISNYHIEINLGNYGTNDKLIISDFLTELASMTNLITNDLKVFIIKDVDKLSLKAQIVLCNLIDSTHRTARYIFTCTNITNIISSLKNKFILLRNPLPNRSEVAQILKIIAAKENIKTSTRAINIIIENSLKLSGAINLNYIINIFHMSYLTGKYVRYDTNFTQYFDDLINLIEKKFTLQNINKIREIIYIIYVSNINITLVFTYITKYFLAHVHNNSYKCDIIYYAAKYEKLMKNGNKEPLYLETFILNIINILHNNNDIIKTKRIKIKSKCNDKNIKIL